MKTEFYDVIFFDVNLKLLPCFFNRLYSIYGSIIISDFFTSKYFSKIAFTSIEPELESSNVAFWIGEAGDDIAGLIFIIFFPFFIGLFEFD